MQIASYETYILIRFSFLAYIISLSSCNSQNNTLLLTSSHVKHSSIDFWLFFLYKLKVLYQME